MVVNSRSGELLPACVRDAVLVGLHAMLPERHTELQREQLVELQPLPGQCERAVFVREMHVAHGSVVGDQRVSPDQRRRHGVVQRGQPNQRAVDQLADGARGDAFGRRVHRRDAAGVDQVGIVAAQQLHLLMGQLQPALVHRGDARDGDLLTLPIDRGRPRLVEEREIQVARTVTQGDGHHRLTTTCLSLRDLVHVSDHRGVPADLQIADRLDARTIDVTAGVVMQQRAHGVDVEGRPEHLGGGALFHALLPAPCRALRERRVDIGDRRVERERRGSIPHLPSVLPCRG